LYFLSKLASSEFTASMKFYLLIIISFLFAGCFRNPADNRQNEYIFSIEGNPVYTDEFLYNLDKNNYSRESSISGKEINEYLDLYINFKLKVHEARLLGLDTTKAYKIEYKKYLDQLSESFMKDDSIVEQLVREAYLHRQTEIKASHILIRVENPANPQDTLQAYQKIHQVYEMANDGHDFNRLAVRYSEDPSAAMNQGNLGYFTALQMVYPFEKAAYTTPAGKISSPFKTRFGYHILKVDDIRPAQGKVEVAHIMLGFNNGSGRHDSLRIAARIHSIYDSLMQEGEWNYFCEKYSEDINSKENEGKLSPFPTGKIFPSFSDAAFALKNPGDISQPVQTPYGWHIIKLIRKYSPGSFDELKEELVSRIKQDSRSDISKDLLIGKLKKENGFYINQMISDQVMLMADSTILNARWNYDPSGSLLDSTLFSIGDQRFIVRDFFDYVRAQQKPVSNMAPSYYFSHLLKYFIDGEVINYEKNHLGEKYFDYRMLSREYAEGILLFDIMDTKIWSYAIRDTAGLEHFYRLNIDRYQWGQRLDAIIFRSSEIHVIDELRDLLNEPYAYMSATQVPVILDSEGYYKEKAKNSIDSLYRLLDDNESWCLELSEARKNAADAFLLFLKESGYNISRIFVKSGQAEEISLKVVSVAKKDFSKAINDKWGVDLHIESGIYQQGENDIIDLIDWQIGLHDLSIDQDEYLIYVDRILPPMDQELIEVQGKVISDYQEYLEKEWIGELKRKYDIRINQKLLKNIIRNFEKS
jgi:peptidyl-prolyl cis-trans isomerase SurA